MGSIRLHEIAKALGVPNKTLMGELSAQGVDLKTHMAVVDEKILNLLLKKYPDIEKKVAASKESTKKAAASVEADGDETTAVKKKRTTKTAKPITQRNATKKGAKAEEEEGPAANEIEFLRRDEGGSAGTVTLEQRVVKEGVLRRRRVENAPPPPPAPVATAPAPAPTPTTTIEAPSSGVIRRPPTTLSTPSAPILKRIEPEIEIPEPVKTPPVATTPEVMSTPEEVAAAPTPPPPAPVAPTPVKPAAPVGRNLSAGSRLKIVDQPAIPPRPMPRPGAPRPTPRPTPSTGVGATDARNKLARPAVAGAAAPAEGFESSEDAVKKEAAKKKAATKTTGEAAKYTKRDLLGMMEEVEITRPLGRRPKKPVQKIERKSTQITTPGASKRKIRIENEITVADLADRMGVKAADVIRKLISQGQMVTMHHHLDLDTATLIAGEYNYEVQNVAETVETVLNADHDSPDAESGMERAPIVTIMGHVDHGKTSLLDYIRKSRVVAGEAGGITQHIGAYQVEHNGKKITFIDTPGHAAFTAMRARGASLTDIVILVVAADEGVKPQTLEALAHAKAAKVPVIVAVNKIDKPEAKPDQVMTELSGHELVPEAWGGDTIYVKLSAQTGEGIPELLEMILIQSEVLGLKANPERAAKGIVIESRLDKGKGPVATVIIQTGTLKMGMPMVSGSSFGKVRALFDDKGQAIQSAGPSTPVEILGFDAVPEAGEAVSGVSEDAIARKASELATLARKKVDALKNSRMSLEDMYQKMQTGDVSELRVILKGDVQGSVEAIADSLSKIKHDKVRVNVLYKAVGGISESDIDLAAASGALVFGFNVRPTSQAKQLAARENVQIKTYEIIYELLDEVKLGMQGLLAPIIKENVVGQAEVRNVFTISKVGPVAGCFVKSGKIIRNANGRLIRDNVVIYTAKIASVRRFKDDTREVAEGFECGIRLENYSDFKVGDIIECFETTSMAQAVG